MDTLQLTIQPLSAFGGIVKGDTLFGHFCWAIANRFGEMFLNEQLQGYRDGKPFLICSDAFPCGYIPRPALPLENYDRLPDEDRKRVKKRQWLPLSKVTEPVPRWLTHCRSEREVAQAFNAEANQLSKEHAQPHNSIHRGLNTTQGGEFAPYTSLQHWFASGLRLDIWLLYDPQRITDGQLTDLASDIGTTGYGRDAAIGLGKFRVVSSQPVNLPQQPKSNSAITLAPCAPQGLELDADHCYYEPFTRFGRHGDRAVLTGKPFKNPVLLANTGAVITGASTQPQGFVGQGLGGAGRLSNAIEGTVHQGYAPSIGIHLQEVGT